MAKKAPRKQLPPLKATKATKATKAKNTKKVAARSPSKSKSPVRKTKAVPTPKTKKITKAPKRIRRSRSMEATIREGEQFLAHRKNIEAQKQAQNKKISQLKIAADKRTAKAVLSRSKKISAPAPFFIPPLVPVSYLVDNKKKSASKVSSSSRVNFKNNPNLPLPQFGVIDICFCIDATGSMSSYLAQSKRTVIDIINKIQSKVQTQGIELRFAVVTYRDHPPQESTYVTKVKDFTDDREIRSYIEKLDAAGGGDFPEAVHDGLLVAARDLTWRNYPMIPSLRYIFHIADAPPHGKQFNQGSKNGCTCGITTDAVTHAINHQQIHYRLIKINSHPDLDKMEQLFKKNIVDFQSAQIKNASEMNIKVSDMIIREVMPL